MWYSLKQEWSIRCLPLYASRIQLVYIPDITQQINYMSKKDEIITFLKQRIAQILDYSEPIQSDESIHDLGLTSLNAVIISGELEDRVDVDVDPAVMFTNDTIEKIAEQILKDE